MVFGVSAGNCMPSGDGAPTLPAHWAPNESEVRNLQERLAPTPSLRQNRGPAVVQAVTREREHRARLSRRDGKPEPFLSSYHVRESGTVQARRPPPLTVLERHKDSWIPVATGAFSDNRKPLPRCRFAVPGWASVVCFPKLIGERESGLVDRRKTTRILGA